jgi:hypothetical protein
MKNRSRTHTPVDLETQICIGELTEIRDVVDWCTDLPVLAEGQPGACAPVFPRKEGLKGSEGRNYMTPVLILLSFRLHAMVVLAWDKSGVTPT